MKKMLNKGTKRASVGEAITWVVATIIILVVLLIFIYASNVLGLWKTYKISSGEVSADIDSQLTTKTEIAFAKAEKVNMISPEEETGINNWIKGAKLY
jgi:hypothetical protein